MLANIQPGDEIIMPSFTFVSTANAFVLRGGVPVFIDIREDTCNMDENIIEDAITPRTKVILPVHYAGVSCEMDTINYIAKKYNIIVIEDAAQSLLSTYKNKKLGTIGDFGTFSFHETKNITSGEGGCLTINNSHFFERAEIIREKGTNRKKFFRGQVDKYSWVDIGSSFLPNELTSAFLSAQLNAAENITMLRRELWNKYHNALYEIEQLGFIRRPFIPEYCEHNGHIYYIILNSFEERTNLINFLSSCGISAAFHYVPLHDSQEGIKCSRTFGFLTNTVDISKRLLRLPMWIGADVFYVCENIKKFFKI